MCNFMCALFEKHLHYDKQLKTAIRSGDDVKANEAIFMIHRLMQTAEEAAMFGAEKWASLTDEEIEDFIVKEYKIY